MMNKNTTNLHNHDGRFWRFAPKVHGLGLNPDNPSLRCHGTTTVTPVPHCRTPKTLNIRYECDRIRCMKQGPHQSREIIHSYINWIPTTFPNTTWPPSSRYFVVFLTSLAKFTMRFILFIITGATLTLFNTYAYAKPVPASSLDQTYCDGYDNDSCHDHCIHEGFTHSNCTT